MQGKCEFGIRHIPAMQRVDIFFDKTYIFCLSYQEWANLIFFLKKTISRKNLPKGSVQFAEFSIERNLCINLDLGEYEKLLRNVFGYDDKYIAKELLKAKRKGEKNFISERVGLLTSKFAIWIDRGRFERFRKFCLYESKTKNFNALIEKGVRFEVYKYKTKGTVLNKKQR